MDIVWLGHSCLRLRSLRTTLITDPYGEAIGLALPRQKADIVTISHDHPHHSSPDALEGRPRVLRGPGEYEIADFYITGMGTRRLNLEGDDRGSQVNTIYLMRVEGLTLCHLGDLNETLPPAKVQELNDTDVLFVPAGGVCTISVAKAAELVNRISPKIVVPLHYRADGADTGLEPLQPFLSEMGLSEVEPRGKLDVTSSNLPRELQVWVLQRSA